MIRFETPTTLALCGRLPAGIPSRDLEACLALGEGGMPVSWIVRPGHVGDVAARLAAAGRMATLAVEIPQAVTPGGLRKLLEQARADAPEIDAAWIMGDLGPHERRLLVAAGIRVAGTHRLDGSRGSRRPAPPGWSCVSTAWGLWEVLWSSASPPGLFSWSRRSVAARGTLTVVDVTAAGPLDAGTLRGRLDRWRSWGSGRITTGRLRCASLSELPDLITGTAHRPAAGSILRAA